MNRTAWAVAVALLLLLLVPLPGRAEGLSSNANILMAPQLSIAGNGPVTATFLGSSEPYLQLMVGWEAPGAQARVGFFFGDLLTAPGATFQAIPDHLGRPLASGTDLVFATRFSTGNGFAMSLSGASPSMATFFSHPAFEGEPFHTVLVNAGVLRLSPDSVLIGFNPPGFAAPTRFADFAVRISVSNVCAK